jgi:hypothetical protein
VYFGMPADDDDALAGPGGPAGGDAAREDAAGGRADGASPGAGFASVAGALRAGRAVVDYLSSPAARDLDGPACGEALVEIGAIASGLGAAHTRLLRRFDAGNAHDGDGYASTAAWLAARAGLGRRDAKAAVRQMRLLSRHPLPGGAATGGAVSMSRAREMAGWTRRIGGEEIRHDADQILLGAAAAGAGLDGLRVIAQAACEAWRSRHPDQDPPGKGFEDRFAQLDPAMDGAGRLAGDLTPECAAAVTAVLQALTPEGQTGGRVRPTPPTDLDHSSDRTGGQS